MCEGEREREREREKIENTVNSEQRIPVDGSQTSSDCYIIRFNEFI